jgi:hypothetical protein
MAVVARLQAKQIQTTAFLRYSGLILRKRSPSASERAQIVDPPARHVGVGDPAQRTGPSYLVWGLAGDAGMLLVVPHLLSGAMCQIQLPKRGLSKARAPRGAMTKIESNVHIVVAISYSSPQLKAHDSR